MGRKAKCRACGKDLDTTTAFKLIAHDTNGKPKTSYYCSRDEYEADEEKKRKAAADKDRAYKLICQIIDREKIINTALWREWKEWNTVADDEIIAQYLEENQDYLVGAISRLEDKEFNRIRYLSAILKNSLGDYKPKAIVKEVEKPKIFAEDVDIREDVGLRENKKKKGIRRKGFAEMDG